MKLIKMNSEEWSKYAENAHLVVFNERRPADFNRIDFTILITYADVPQTFATCRELDKETVYLQYGGAFPPAMNTVRSFRCYELTICELANNYKRATTLIENENTTMLKFAMRVGFRIIGVRMFEGKIYLEHLIDFGGDNGEG